MVGGLLYDMISISCHLYNGMFFTKFLILVESCVVCLVLSCLVLSRLLSSFDVFDVFLFPFSFFSFFWQAVF